MDLSLNDIEGSPEEIGSVGDEKVLHVRTKGGFHTLWKTGRGQSSMVGSGARRVVAMAVADRILKNKVSWTVLEKSEPPSEEEVSEWLSLSLQAK